ncbi:MAG: DUF2339 domain-containing protein [Pseudomonadota bacterium]
MTFLLAVGALVAALVALQRIARLQREVADLRQHAGIPPSPGTAKAAPPASPAPVAPQKPQWRTTPETPKKRLLKEKPPTGTWWEEQMTSHWLVWVGGLALALGGGFLVKYSIDEGLLGPGLRIALGVIAALAMMGAGEWLRRQPVGRLPANIDPSHVPAAATGAGLFTAFASLFAAYDFYHFLSPLAAFLLLAGVCAAAFLLAVLHGRFLVLLGLVGAYSVPALVSTTAPSLIGLLVYLLAVAGLALAVIRYRQWWALGWGAMAGVMAWPLLWMAAHWRPGDGWALGLYALTATALLVSDWRPYRLPPGLWQPQPQAFAPLSAAAGGLLVFAIVRLDGYGAAGLAALAAMALLLTVAAFRRPPAVSLAIIAATLVFFSLGLWHQPALLRPETLGLPAANLAPLVPPAARPYLLVLAGFALFHGVGGYWASQRHARPGAWAGISVLLPLGLMAAAYARIAALAPDFAWGAASALLALAFSLAAERHARPPENALPTAAYVLGAVAALMLATAMVLRDNWLSLALAGELAAIAYLFARRWPLAPLEWAAAALALLVAARQLLHFPAIDHGPALLAQAWWALYAWTLPALAVFAARHWFSKRSQNNGLANSLEGSAVITGALAVFALALMLANLFPSFGPGGRQLAATGISASGWLALAYAFIPAPRGTAAPMTRLSLAGLLLFSAGAVISVVREMLTRGYLAVHYGPPFFNLIGLSVLIPGLGALALSRTTRLHPFPILAQTIAGAGLVGVFLWLNLEVRHLFHGDVLALRLSAFRQGELYAYSAAWLPFALALLGWGIKTRNMALRRLALGVLAATILKVFLIDMAALSGVLRALSFLGLGAVLVGVGAIYRKIVFPLPSKNARTTGDSPS